MTSIATIEAAFQFLDLPMPCPDAHPSYLYEVSSARAPEGFHSVKEEPQRKDFQVDFPFENPTGYKKPTARYKQGPFS